MIEFKEFLHKTDLLNKLAQLADIPLFIVDFKQEVFHSHKLCEVVKHTGRCPGDYLHLLYEVMNSGKPGWEKCGSEYLRIGLPLRINEKVIGVLIGCQHLKKQDIKQNLQLIGDVLTTAIYNEFEIDDMSREITELYEELNLLYNISKTVSNIFDIDAVCQMLVEKAVEMVRVERASLMLVDRERTSLKIVAAHGLSQEIIKNTRVKIGEGVAGKVVRSR